MKTGLRGTFAISWDQTELDGVHAAPPAMMRVGQSWRWGGEPVRLDGPADILQLGDAVGMAEIRLRAATAVRHLLSAVEADIGRFDRLGIEAMIPDAGFTVTDGRQVWPVVLNGAASYGRLLAVFPAGLPPRRTELWVVAVAQQGLAKTRLSGPKGGMVCFTPGTMIATDKGPERIEDLREGCRVQTKDNGCQDVLWIGQQRISGARLHALPHLAPIRLRAGALDNGVPDAGLLVSPDHRLVLRAPRARALFNADEVLVAARDLVNDHTVRVERGHRDITYIHLLLPAHEIIFANAVEAESFHPASADLAVLDDDQLSKIEASCPGTIADPPLYGNEARRILGPSEAAILQFDRM
jgi:hypothetical protein